MNIHVYSDLLEIAAWVIIVRAVGEFLWLDRKAKRLRIEEAAVKSEYSDSVDAEYKIDQHLPEHAFQRQLTMLKERQKGLLMRYPQYLVREPDVRYFKEGEAQEKANQPTIKDKTRNLAISGAVYVFFGVIAFTLYYAYKFLLAGIGH